MHDVNLFAVCAVAVSVTIAFVFLSLSGSLVRQLCAVLDRKLETILRRLSYNLIQYLTVFVLLYQIFNYLGFPTSTVLASVGLASLAITLGAQGLVADILSGIFNVFEGGYHVGDYIQAGDFEGTVREIGVSTSSQPPRESVMTLAISAECLQRDYFEVKKYVYREVLLLCQREHIPLT